jgi:hypothetical protein
MALIGGGDKMRRAESPSSCTSAVLAMRTMFRPETADGVTVRIGFRLAELARVGARNPDLAAAVVRTESGRQSTPAHRLPEPLHLFPMKSSVN